MTTLRVVLYLAAVLASAICAVLLLRAYLASRVRLLLWSAICFLGLTVNNMALFFDLVVFPTVDLRLVRLVPALVGMLCLLYGFIWDEE